MSSRRLLKENHIKNKQNRRLGYLMLIVLFLALFCAGCGQEKSKDLTEAAEIHFIDTGNSDAILIKQGEHAALIDGGDNVDEKMLPDYLKEQGIKELEYLFMTHPDADHIGGLDGVIHAFKVKQAFVGNGKAETKTYTDVIEALMAEGITPSVPLLNSEFQFGSGSFKVLSVAHAKDVNNTSLVMLFTNGEDKVLLMGDAGQDIEQTITAGPVDLVKIGHHGSKNSSSKNFLEQIQPKYAVITCGRQNKFGHPHKETMQTLEELHIPVYRTDESGSIVFISTGHGLSTNAAMGSYTSGTSLADDTENDMPQENISEPSKVESHEKIYFTLKGKKYHRIPNCSGMKNPIEGTIEDADGRERCDKCYK